MKMYFEKLVRSPDGAFFRSDEISFGNGSMTAKSVSIVSTSRHRVRTFRNSSGCGRGCCRRWMRWALSWGDRRRAKAARHLFQQTWTVVRSKHRKPSHKDNVKDTQWMI